MGSDKIRGKTRIDTKFERAKMVAQPKKIDTGKLQIIGGNSKSKSRLDLQRLHRFHQMIFTLGVTQLKRWFINHLEVPQQSAFRQFHSTETALLKIRNGMLRALDRKECICVFLVLLNLSAAFDTVDHNRLPSFLSQAYGITTGALQWIESYLHNKQQAVMSNGADSRNRLLEYGIPQGSVLGPELFKDYVASLADLIHSYDVEFHGYADDTQLYVSFKPGEYEDKALKQMQDCITAVKTWMGKNTYCPLYLLAYRAATNFLHSPRSSANCLTNPRTFRLTSSLLQRSSSMLSLVCLSGAFLQVSSEERFWARSQAHVSLRVQPRSSVASWRY